MKLIRDFSRAIAEHDPLNFCSLPVDIGTELFHNRLSFVLENLFVICVIIEVHFCMNRNRCILPALVYLVSRIDNEILKREKKID